MSLNENANELTAIIAHKYHNNKMINKNVDDMKDVIIPNNNFDNSETIADVDDSKHMKLNYPMICIHILYKNVFEKHL